MGRYGEIWGEGCPTLAAPNPSPIARSIAPVTPRSYVVDTRYGEIRGEMLEIWGDCVAPTWWRRQGQGGEIVFCSVCRAPREVDGRRVQ